MTGNIKATGIAVVLALASNANGETIRHPQLEALVAEAMAHHPELVRARHVSAAAWQVPPRLGSMPDPMLIVAVQNFRVDQPSLTSSPMSGIEIALKQDIPFPGKLGRRSAVATEAARVAERGIEEKRVMIALRVREAYWRLHFAEASESIAIRNEKVLETLANTVLNRFSVGQAAQQDALQARVAHTRMHATVLERREAVESAKHALNGAIGREPDTGVAATEEPTPESVNDERATLLAKARAQNPTLLAHRAEVVVSEQSLRLAKYDRWPDFQLGAGYRIRGVVPGDPSNGADMFGVTFGMTLPVWMASKQNARVRQAKEELEAARASVEDSALDVATELERTLDALERLNQEIELYTKEVGSQSRQALDASISDYQVGRVGFVSVLQNWQVELEVELTVVRLLSEREERLAEFQALVGGPS